MLMTFWVFFFCHWYILSFRNCKIFGFYSYIVARIRQSYFLNSPPPHTHRDIPTLPFFLEKYVRCWLPIFIYVLLFRHKCVSLLLYFGCICWCKVIFKYSQAKRESAFLFNNMLYPPPLLKINVRHVTEQFVSTFKILFKHKGHSLEFWRPSAYWSWLYWYKGF